MKEKEDDFTVQTLKAVEDADLVFVTDFSGILPHDFELSSILRKKRKR